MPMPRPRKVVGFIFLCLPGTIGHLAAESFPAETSTVKVAGADRIKLAD